MPSDPLARCPQARMDSQSEAVAIQAIRNTKGNSQCVDCGAPSKSGERGLGGRGRPGLLGAGGVHAHMDVWGLEGRCRLPMGLGESRQDLGGPGQSQG